MSVTFKSKATGDLFMVSVHAEALLEPLGKTGRQPGILTVEQMPAALNTLRSLPDDAPEEAPEDDDEDQAPTAAKNADGVSLRKRAWPFVKMIEEAQAANEPIVWGV